MDSYVCTARTVAVSVHDALRYHSSCRSHNRRAHVRISVWGVPESVHILMYGIVNMRTHTLLMHVTAYVDGHK